MPGVLVQAAIAGRPRPRFHVAVHQVSARAWAHRHLQPLLLRGGPGGARAPRDTEATEATRAEHRQENLGRTAQGHRAFRGLSWPAGNHHSEVLFAYIARRAEEALHAAP